MTTIPATPRGLFVGLSTLDVIQLVDQVPGPDEKVAALDLCVAAGGPAANAAVAFAALGGHSTLVTRLGSDEVGRLAAADLAAHGVEVVNAAGESQAATTVASILVTRSTGQRAVVSTRDAGRSQEETPDPGERPSVSVDDFDVVLMDSYEVDLSLPVARAAKAAEIPVVLDCGSKKSQTDAQLPYVSLAAVSENYLPASSAAIVADLQNHRVPFGVVTAGSGPLTYWDEITGPTKPLEVAAVAAVDTLGAGDFFHGALAYALATNGLRPETLRASLRFASDVATLSVQSFGSRAWLAHLGSVTSLPRTTA